MFEETEEKTIADFYLEDDSGGGEGMRGRRRRRKRRKIVRGVSRG